MVQNRCETAGRIIFFLHRDYCLSCVLLLVGCPGGPVISRYFSAVTYTTTGYGDLGLPKEWRLVGGGEAPTGILTCGWSIGFFFAVVSGMLDRRSRLRLIARTRALGPELIRSLYDFDIREVRHLHTFGRIGRCGQPRAGRSRSRVRRFRQRLVGTKESRSDDRQLPPPAAVRFCPHTRRQLLRPRDGESLRSAVADMVRGPLRPLGITFYASLHQRRGST